MSEMKYDPSMFEKLDESEKNDEAIAMESKTFLQDTWRRFCSNKLAILGLVVLVIMILLAIFVPMFSKYTYDGQDLANTNALPSAAHLLGTDKLGRDILVRVCSGMRVTLAIGFTSAAINLCIGIVYGGCAGYFGGRVDMTMMRIVDIIYTVPDVLLIVLLSFALKDPLNNLANAPGFKWVQTVGTNLISIFIVFALLYWVGMARMVRSQILMLKESEYVTAARELGVSNGKIIKNHLLTNCIGTLIVTTTLQIPSSIFTESFLSFLGMGVAVPLPSLGSLASDAINGIGTYPYLLFIPAVAISLIILSFNLLGDGLRDAFDPKLKN